jgi:gliding motility-associated-like protein
MLKKVPVFVLLFFSLQYSIAQNTQDTINNPYWIEMMQNQTLNIHQTQRAFNLYWSNKSIEKGNGWKAFKRWEYLSLKLVDSLGYFPNSGFQYQDFLNKVDADNKLWDIAIPGLGPGTAACKNQGNWKSIGPNSLPINNTGQMNGMGRVNAIALHPTDTNTIFIGSAAGGIWKTTDGGITWKVNSDSLPTLGVSAIAINPSNPSIMYFGSGDRDAGDAAGFGVFKSNNSGLTWFISNNGMGNRKVSRIIIDPNNVNILIAATDNGIYRSVNSGVNWTQTFNGGFFKDIIFKPNNSKVVYATKDALFYRSVDNGINWTNLTNGLPTTSISRAVIEVNARDPKMVYFWIAVGSVHKGIYLSRDSGTTFKTQSTTPNLHDYATNGSGSSGQAWYNMDMVSDPSNQAILYCGGVNVFKSTDTGKTWTIAGYWVNQIHADQHELAASPITNQIFAGNDGGLYASRNKGGSWMPIGSGLGIAQIYKMGAARNVKNILINGYQDNGTANYNKNWYTTYGGDGMDCEIDQTDSRYSYGELYYGSIFRVFNVNAQATIANNGYKAAGSDTINESGGWVTPFTLREGFGNTMYIGYKNIWRSNNIKNSTVTWKKISNNLGGLNSVDFNEIESNIANSDVLYAARSNGTLFRSDNVNATSPTWSTLTLPLTGVVNAIETDPKNQNAVYIGIGNKVYKSNNKGSNWTQVLTNFPYNVSSILLDTSNKKRGLYVATMGGGVWYTDTTQTSWRYFSKGLPNTVNVTDLEMYYEPNKACNCNILYGSTYNRGNYYTTIFNDGTQKPVALLDPYDTVICTSAVLSFNSKTCNNPSRFKWAFSPSSFTFLNSGDSTTENPSIKFTNPGIYTYNFMAENCHGIDTISGFITVGDTAKKTCIPTTNNNFGGLGIFNVNISNINRASGDRSQEGPYVDVSCSNLIKVKRGKKYALKVVTGQYNNEQVKAFIDYNNNGLLTDAGELVYQPAAGLINHLDTIAIPINAKVGTIMRMRIRSDFNSLGTNPCSNLNYGQTEDYGLFIEPELIPKFVSNKPKVCPNAVIVFTDSSNLPGIKYQWNFGFAATPSSAIGKGPHSVYYASSGYKTVTLSIDGKTTKKDSAVFIYRAPKMQISWIKGDSSLCLGKSFVLKANDLNVSGATYQWQHNSINIKDSTTQYYRIGSSKFIDSGSYSIIASNQCKDTAVVYLKIRPKPLMGLSVNDSTQCYNGHSFKLKNQSSIAFGNFKNIWKYSDNFKDSNLNSNHTFSGIGKYAVKLICYTPFSCMDSLIQSLEVYESPKASFSISPQEKCFKGNSFAFSNSSTFNSGVFSSYWDMGDGSTSNVFSPSNKSYKIFDSIYTVKLVLKSAKLCTDSIQNKIKLWPQTKLKISLNDSIQCFKSNNFIISDISSIASGNYSIQWNMGDGNLKSGNFISHAYSSNGSYNLKLNSVSDKLCRDTLTKNLKVLESPRANFTINDTIQCLIGNSFVLDDKTISNLTYSRKWLHPLPSANQGISEVFSSSDTGINLVSLIVSNNLACSDSIVKKVYVAAMPEFEVNGPKELCKFDSAAFSIIGHSNNKYDWEVNNVSKGSGQSLLLIGQNQGFQNFEIIATSPYACVSKKSLNNFVFVNDLPFVDFTDSISYQDPLLLLTYKDKSNSSTVSRNWFFSNGNTGSNRIESFLINDSTFISAKLTIIDTNNCKAEISKSMVYKVPFYIPNAFSPNNDGINDIFRIYGLYKYKNFSSIIYNRWGEVLFNSNDPKIGWNGLFMGEIVPNGHYLYSIEFENQDGSKTIENGTILLIR